MEGVAQAHVIAAGTLHIACVHAHVGDEEIEQAIPVVVEEDRAGGVAHVANPRLCGDIAEPAAAHVFEQAIPVAHGGHEQVGIAVVVDVGERRRDRHVVRHRHARLVGDVREPAIAYVLPQLVPAELGNEVEIGPPVAVDIGGGQPRAVIVVDFLVGFARVVDDPIHERDEARLASIDILEVVDRRRPCSQDGFLGAPLAQPGRPGRGGAFTPARPARGEHEQGGDKEPQGAALVQMTITPQPELLPSNSPGVSDEPR